MEALTDFVNYINGIVWGPAMLVFILGVGLFLQIGLKIMPILRIGTGFRLLFRGRQEQGDGQISPFNALMTSLSATIGTGNIAGVATAIFLGGPGALFWMWMTALVGMATKYAEAVCAVKYREQDDKGNYLGGPMYYIKNGLSSKWYWLAPRVWSRPWRLPASSGLSRPTVIERYWLRRRHVSLWRIGWFRTTEIPVYTRHE